MEARARITTKAVKRRLRAIFRAALPIRVDSEFSKLPLYSKSKAITDLAEDRSRAIKRYRKAVEALRLHARRSEEDAELYREAVERLGVDELTLFDVVMITRNQKWQLEHGDSFFRKMVERRRFKQLGNVPEKHLGINKRADLSFADAVEVATPTTLWAGRLTEIPEHLRRGTFLKPTQSSGAKGAFYLFSDGNIFSAFSSKKIETWDELLASSRSQVLPGLADEMSWELQELVSEGPSQPARDMKFFVFYGQIGLIQEVSRYPRKEYEFFNEDGSLAQCGRDRQYEPPFLDPSHTITDKGGLSEEKLQTVRDMSLTIPAPFMRIDFLNGEDKLVFCEFSASPGMAHTFNRQYDQILGRMYNQALIRLTDDLLAGKTFDAFQKWSVDSRH